MTLPAFKRIFPPDYELATVEGNCATSFGQLLGLPIADGRLITGLTLVTGKPLVVNHSLNRQPLGYFIADNSANASIWRSAPSTPSTIQLSTSANTTAAIWIF